MSDIDDRRFRVRETLTEEFGGLMTVMTTALSVVAFLSR